MPDTDQARYITINGGRLEVYTTSEAATHCGVAPATYRDYTRKLGAPGALTYRDQNGELLFDAIRVRQWQANRPGRGRWTRPRT